MPKFTLLVDGQKVALPEVLNDVKIIVEEVEEVEDVNAQVHHTFTHEGVIVDVIDGEGNVLVTNSRTYDEF